MGRLATHSASEIIGAREGAAAALDEAGLDNYLFSVEPRDEGWHLKVEHPVLEGWQSVTVPVDGALLLASRTDREARRRLAQSFRERLSV
jgi:hypothetical protein